MGRGAPRRSVLGILALVAWALVLAGCRESSIDPATVPALPVGLEPAVSDHLEERRSALLESSTGQDRSEAWGALGMAAHGYSLYDLATRSYREAASSSPDDYRWAYYLGRVRLEAGDPAQAAEGFQRALKVRPGEPWGTLGLGQSLLELDEPREARTVLERVVAAKPSEGVAWLGLGDAHLALGETGQAIETFRRVLELQPEATRVYGRLADAHRLAGDLEAASAAVEASGDGRVEYRDPWMLTVVEGRRGVEGALESGQLAFESGRFAEARDHFRRATDLAPDRATAWLNLGASHLALGELAEADRGLRRAVELDPEDARAHFNLGTLRSRQGNLSEASEYLERTLEIEPTHWGAAINLGNLRLRSGDCTRAAENFGSAIRGPDTPVEARVGLVVALSCLALDREALEQAAEGAAMQPGSSVLANAVARLLAAGREPGMRDGDRAVGVAQGLIEAETSLEFVETLAMALAEAGRFDEAIVWQERALEAAEASAQLDWATVLRSNLDRYRNGRAAPEPWPLFRNTAG